MIIDSKRAESQLREKLAVGQSLADALREMNGSCGIGLIELYYAVEKVCGMPRPEAMKLVVKETFALRSALEKSREPDSNI